MEIKLIGFHRIHSSRERPETSTYSNYNSPNRRMLYKWKNKKVHVCIHYMHIYERTLSLKPSAKLPRNVLFF